MFFCFAIRITVFKYLFQIYRVFYDRLVDDSDRKWLHEFVTKVTKEVLNEDYIDLFQRLLAKPGNTTVTEDDMRSLMFCDFQVIVSILMKILKKTKSTSICHKETSKLSDILFSKIYFGNLAIKCTS